MLDMVASRIRHYNKDVLDPVVQLAVEIAREGREGRRIGTLFTVGDSNEVLSLSRPIILDPLALHARQKRLVRDPNLQGTIKELAQLDGAFVVSDTGEFVAACRYLQAPATHVSLPLGLGARHLAAASMSEVTECVAVVASASAVVRLFDHGALVAEIIPELWLFGHQGLELRGLPLRPIDEV